MFGQGDIGKGLGGGIFPLAALITRTGLDVAPDRALGHYTHEKNPVACAAARATIEVLEGGLFAEVKGLGAYALAELEAIEKRHAVVRDVRGLGLLLSIKLTAPGPGMTGPEAAERVTYGALRNGLNFKVTMSTILTLTPALTITRQEMDAAIAIIDRELTAVERAAALDEVSS